ncbi:hypothetical protein, partial [Streptomyces sp. NPDC048527]|uniref:hypothetical protein n=1 Tax=Streptomyces sp. NPDC048527 TaxID=3365568 RepID=UPI0037179DD4
MGEHAVMEAGIVQLDGQGVCRGSPRSLLLLLLLLLWIGWWKTEGSSCSLEGWISVVGLPDHN